MNQIAEEILMHYGIKRRSGRYPWGSGEDPYQHGRDFLGRVEELKKNGWTETPENIKEEFGLTTTEYRMEKAIAKDERRMLRVARVKSLQEDGLNPTEIGREMGINESTVRSLLNQKSELRMMRARNTADFLREQIETKGMIDVGTSVERELSAEWGLNISKETLNQALYLLEREGYPVYKGGIPQLTNPGQQSNQRIICPKGTPYKDIYQYDQIHTINDYISRDGGETYEKKFHYPESMDSKRLMVRYAEDGGIDRDGIVEIRRGVEDLSLGDSHYSQVRILVDKTHYIKGMAVYSDDLPDGVDVIFNTNKKKGTPALGPKDNTVLKHIKDDPDNPFGSLIKDADQGGQYWYGPEGNKKLGLINKRADEGDWTDWQDTLPSQFLSKQSLSMAKKQLGLAKADKMAEYEEILSCNNPTIKKHLLNKFADECDSASVHLKAAALPGQKYHVIIPINTLTDKEVYAPGYDNGTKLALIRYPHGGTFEIPILTVNNKNVDGKKWIGDKSIDAIGINKNIADKLSGADFDGDTVMCIPTHDSKNKVKISSRDSLPGLEGFDPKETYAYSYDDIQSGKAKLMTKKGTQHHMGVISNLITDMTLAGAKDEELAAAVRHSMVVIDAEKHKLNYKQSEQDNNIRALHEKYQGKATGGAATIISQAKGQYSVPRRKGSAKINLEGKEWYDPDRPEGALIWKQDPKATYSYKTINKRTGEEKIITRTAMQKSTKMAETDDAYSLISDARHPMEIAYADYANDMKALANQARKEMASTGKIAYNKNAKSIYQAEVDSLEQKLNAAELNRGRERAALRLANAEVNAKKAAYKQEHGEKMDSGDEKKLKQQAVSKAREEVASVKRKDRNIEITDREWEAIQAGAISEHKLKQILNNTDIDALKQRSMPRSTTTVSTAQANKIKAMGSSNFTLQQIAEATGLSKSTVSKYLKGV